MCGQRAIFQAAGNVEPSHAIGMQSEWPRPAQRCNSFSVLQIAWIGRRHGLLVVRIVQSSPLLLFFIPPH